jgi:glycosyltransferase involved in cell wall biosynthesis
VLHTENLELRKDPGQLPYHIGKQYNTASATLVTYYYTLKGGRNNGPVAMPPQDTEQQYIDYPFLQSEVKGLHLDFLPYRGRGKFYERSVLNYLFKNSAKIDVLNLLHFNAENIFYTLLFKVLHPKGKVYIKLDIDIPFYKNTPYFFNAGGFNKLLKVFLFTRLLQPLFFKLAHTISAESQTGMNYFIERFNVPQKKMMLLPNGVDKDKINSRIVTVKNFIEKENIIITVGRIGTSQKNNEMLLDALASINLKDWKVYFIGAIQEEFRPKIDVFFKENPDKQNKVIFTDWINSPAALYQYYNKAKIFCLTSLDEGFPLSACEAAYFGNYLLLTDTIDCFNELTNNSKHGKKIHFNNVKHLSESLNELIDSPNILAESYDGMRAYAESNLTWQAIIPRLYKRLTMN